MSTVTIVRGRRAGMTHTNQPPLTWWPVQLPDKSYTAEVVCKNGHAGIIDEHTIHPDGRVDPSVVCTEDGCGWHEFIVLEGWPPS